jgi:hypothetical protein
MVVHERQKDKQTSFWKCWADCSYYWWIDHYVDHHQIRSTKYQSLILDTIRQAIR